MHKKGDGQYKNLIIGNMRNQNYFTLANSGPKSNTGFNGLVLAGLRVKTPSLQVYRSDCKDA